MRLWVRMDAQWDTQTRSERVCALRANRDQCVRLCKAGHMPRASHARFEPLAISTSVMLKAFLKKQAPTGMSTCFRPGPSMCARPFQSFSALSLHVVCMSFGLHIRFVCVQATPPRVGAFQRD